MLQLVKDEAKLRKTRPRTWRRKMISAMRRTTCPGRSSGAGREESRGYESAGCWYNVIHDDHDDAFGLACVCGTFGGNSLLCEEKASLFFEPLVGVVERLLEDGGGSAEVACASSAGLSRAEGRCL